MSKNQSSQNYLHTKLIPNSRINMINSSERSDILVFNCYLCHVRFLSICYVCSTKIGENSDISKCFEDFVSQALGFLKRFYAAELRYPPTRRYVPTKQGVQKHPKNNKIQFFRLKIQNVLLSHAAVPSGAAQSTRWSSSSVRMSNLCCFSVAP